ncbi:MAG: flagellar export chaperone FliS [Gemmatimonadetes bacterium]|nr:flagellar export chaperone FliS [Gemmatimonadota bacterium]
MTYASSSSDRYREARILGSSREQLVVLLYEHLLVSLRRAGAQIRARDLEGKAASLTRAADIVYELLGALDFDAGGELASRLAALYGFFVTEITEIGRTLDADRLDRLAGIVATLHESWAQAAALHAGANAATA